MINTPVWILWITLLIGFQPEKQGIDPEDAILFQDLEEDVTQGKSISNGSWLRYMEYGDVSVLTKASAHTSSLVSCSTSSSLGVKHVISSRQVSSHSAISLRTS